MENHNKKGFEKFEFWVLLVENISIERRSTKSEIEALIASRQSKSSIQKLPTFSLLESVY